MTYGQRNLVYVALASAAEPALFRKSEALEKRINARFMKCKLHTLVQDY
jgi:hypothetical protein